MTNHQICPRCGAERPYAEKFCGFCGGQLPEVRVPTANDTQCQNPNCREWFPKVLKSCPMCDTPRTLPVAQQIQLTSATQAYLVEVMASPEEIELRKSNKGCAGAVGFLLCLTGIGAIIGIPMIISSYFKPPKTSWYFEGPCPWCRATIRMGDQQAGRCPQCNKTFMVNKQGSSAIWEPYT